MIIACVAIIGRANNLLFIRSFNSQVDQLRFHFIVHSALDIIEDKLQEQSGSALNYLGLLYPTEDFKVYGFRTNTNAKIVVVVDDLDTKDTDVRAFIERMNGLYVKAVCNPFYTMNEEITSNKFEVDVAKLVAQSSTSA